MTKTEQPSSPQAIADAVMAMVQRLERPDWPRDGICQHLGISISVGDTSVGILPRSGRLCVAIYDHGAHIPTPTVRRCKSRGHVISKSRPPAAIPSHPAKLHRERAECVAVAMQSNIIERWNGENGHSGISFVLGRWAPESLVIAIQNYCRLPNVFKLTADEQQRFAAFRQWLDAPAAVGKAA